MENPSAHKGSHKITTIQDLFSVVTEDSCKEKFMWMLSKYLHERFFSVQFGMVHYIERLIIKLNTPNQISLRHTYLTNTQKTESREQQKTSIRQHLIYLRLLQERIASWVGHITISELWNDWYRKMENAAGIDIPELHADHNNLENVLNEWTVVTDRFKEEYWELQNLMLTAEKKYGSMITSNNTIKKIKTLLDWKCE
jgi:hypothetical protein